MWALFGEPKNSTSHVVSCVSETGALNSEQNWSLFYSLDTLDTSDSLCTLSSFFHK
jgi:hypothetical protein